MTTYTPAPVNTDDVTLPSELNEAIELMAEHNHDTWAQGKIAKGYSCGPITDDSVKLHKDLVPYDELPEETKDYDRDTCIANLKLLYKLGYRIEKA